LKISRHFGESNFLACTKPRNVCGIIFDYAQIVDALPLACVAFHFWLPLDELGADFMNPMGARKVI